jgi:hypothetical protein
VSLHTQLSSFDTALTSIYSDETCTVSPATEPCSSQVYRPHRQHVLLPSNPSRRSIHHGSSLSSMILPHTDVMISQAKHGILGLFRSLYHEASESNIK